MDREAIDLLERVGKLLGTIGFATRDDLPRHYLEVMALFDRCRSMLGAVRLLLRHDFGHEAMMLVRPLFTDSLALAEIAAAGETRRVELAIGWELDSLASLEGLLRHGASRGDDVSRERKEFAVRREQLHAYARRHGANPRHWQPDDHAKQLATKHGRDSEWADLLMVQHLVHGSTVATGLRYSKEEDGSVAIGGPAIDRSSNQGTALFAGSSALHAGPAACTIVGMTEPAELSALMTELESMAEASAGPAPPTD